jgi:hypothetical protein
MDNYGQTTDRNNTMTKERVKLLVADIVFMPTWKFTFDEVYRDTAYVYVEFDAPNSDRELARNGHSVTTHPVALMEIDLTNCHTDDDFYRRFVEEGMRTMYHEWCEFLRLRSRDFEAPFHPHIPECRDNWALSGGDPNIVRR